MDLQSMKPYSINSVVYSNLLGLENTTEFRISLDIARAAFMSENGNEGWDCGPLEYADLMGENWTDKEFACLVTKMVNWIHTAYKGKYVQSITTGLSIIQAQIMDPQSGITKIPNSDTLQRIMKAAGTEFYKIHNTCPLCKEPLDNQFYKSCHCCLLNHLFRNSRLLVTYDFVNNLFVHDSKFEQNYTQKWLDERLRLDKWIMENEFEEFHSLLAPHIHHSHSFPNYYISTLHSIDNFLIAPNVRLNGKYGVECVTSLDDIVEMMNYFKGCVESIQNKGINAIRSKAKLIPSKELYMEKCTNEGYQRFIPDHILNITEISLRKISLSKILSMVIISFGRISYSI